MTKLFRWGVIGTGAIARQFAEDIKFAAGNEITAVVARSEASFRSCPTQHPARHFTSAQSLFEARCCDAIYIATPNDLHVEFAISALEAGYPVLVEKPLAINAEQGKAIMKAADRAGLPAMEAMWTVFLPALKQATAMAMAGQIGTIERIVCELAYEKTYSPDNRFFSPQHGGGALRDLGIYGLSVARAFCGPLDLKHAAITEAPNGIDMRARLFLESAASKIEIIAGFDVDGANRCLIEGTEGSLLLSAPFIKCSSFLSGPPALIRFMNSNNPISTIMRQVAKRSGFRNHSFAFEGGGLQFEIIAFSNAVQTGDHTGLWPLSRSVEMSALIDEALAG
jgi:predicted dehydrogenase